MRIPQAVTEEQVVFNSPGKMVQTIVVPAMGMVRGVWLLDLFGSYKQDFVGSVERSEFEI